MVPPPGGDVDTTRLAELAVQLGQEPEAVARRLHDELVAARARIDAGLADGDQVAVGDGAHAARNSALMVGARPLLAGLRAVETAADAGDLPAARAAREQVEDVLGLLIETLGRLG